MLKKMLIVHLLLTGLVLSSVIPSTVLGITEDFRPRDEANWTGYIKHGSGHEKIDGAILVGYVDAGWPSSDYNYRGWATFDINSLPANACVSGVELLGDCFLPGAPNHVFLARVMTEFPPDAVASLLYDDIGAGDWYNDCTSCMRTEGTKSMPLLRGATAALEAAAQGSGLRYFALGFTERGENAIPGWWWGHSESKPVLRVTYTVPMQLAPTPTIAVDSACVGAEFCVTWNAVAGATGYEISDNGGGYWSNTGLGTARCYTRTLTGDYAFLVRARNSCGVGPASQPASVRITTVTAAPANVWTINSVQCVNQNYSVYWDAVAGASSYEVREDNSSWVNTGVNNRATFNNSSAGQHTYSARALNACGGGLATTSSTVTILATPALPARPATTNPNPCPDQTITIKWTAAANAIQYRLYDSVSRRDVYVGSVPSWTAPQSAGIHKYWLKVFNGCGWSASNGPLVVETQKQIARPDPPASDPNPATVDRPYIVSWRKLAGATNYELYEGTRAGSYLIYRGGNLEMSFTKPQPASFFYWIKACGDCGCTEKSVELVVIVSATTAVEEIDTPLLPGSFALSQNYPNPFNPETRIDFSLRHSAYVELTVYNILGETIRTLVSDHMSAGFKAVTWDSHDNSGQPVSSGTYLYRITAGDYTETKKMMLVK